MAPPSPEGAIEFMKKLNLKLVLAAFLSLSLLLCLVLSCASTPKPEGKPVILVVSFGTTYNDTRAKTIDAIENTIAAAYPNYEVRRAWTSQIIINRLFKRDGVKIDNVKDAMKRLVKDNVKEVIVQPTHLLNGIEYEKMMGQIKPYEKRFTNIRFGQPLLVLDRDFQEVASILIENTKQFDAEDTAVVFMGHGSEHEADALYRKMNSLLKSRGFYRHFVATVEGELEFEDVVEDLTEELHHLEVRHVVLLPLMIVAGDHANNDMAGDDEDSWKSVLQGEGYRVTPVLRGLGEYPEIRQIFIRHVAEAARR